MKKEKKYVYWDDNRYTYNTIEEKYFENTEKFKEYFGNYINDELFNENNEIIIYELVPVKTFKKEINYKFV